MIHHCNCWTFIILVLFTVPFYHFLFSRYLGLTKHHFSSDILVPFPDLSNLYCRGRGLNLRTWNFQGSCWGVWPLNFQGVLQTFVVFPMVNCYVRIFQGVLKTLWHFKGWNCIMFGISKGKVTKLKSQLLWLEMALFSIKALHNIEKHS